MKQHKTLNPIGVGLFGANTIGYLYKFDQAALARPPLYDGRPKKRPLLRILRLRHLCIHAQHSLHEVNEHFEDVFNAASAALANL